MKTIAQRIRRLTLESIYHAGSGHPGGCLSIVDILTTLYFEVMNIYPDEPNWEDRDRLVLSKGHACPALYATLAIRGYFPEEELKGLRKLDGMLQGHPELSIPGIDAPSGSLGMGLSQGVGMALAAKHAGKDYKVYVILGDGDMQEGATWEALMAAGNFKLSNLVVILDANMFQGDGTVLKQMNYRPVRKKVINFGWTAALIEGHSYAKIKTALTKSADLYDSPLFIVANTIKGKGVSFMENDNDWHGSVKMTQEQLDLSLEGLCTN